MITIDKNKCKKCNACILQCPYNIIFDKDTEGYPQSNKNFDSHCIECFHCRCLIGVKLLLLWQCCIRTSGKNSSNFHAK